MSSALVAGDPRDRGRNFDVSGPLGCTIAPSDLRDLRADFLGRQHEIDVAAGDRGLGHFRLLRRLQLLGDRDASDRVDGGKRLGAVAVESGHDHRDELSAPIFGERTKEQGYHVGPSARLRNRLQAELAAQDMQIALRRNDEDPVRSNGEPLRDRVRRASRCIWAGFRAAASPYGGDG